MEICGKVVVITGSSRGLGLELAKKFISEGANVVVSSRNKQEFEVIAKEIGAFPIVCDIVDEKQVQLLADATVKKFGKIDYWVNNAGLWLPHQFVEEQNAEQIRRMVEVNLLGTIFGSQSALRKMKLQKSGVIINIVSLSGQNARPRSSTYAASKWGASGFTKSIRLEVEPFGIKVIGVYPGGIKTNIFGEAKPSSFDSFMEPTFVAEKIIENIKKKQPDEEQVIDAG